MKSLKQKLRDWYTRPRKSFIFGLSEWILTDSKAFSILMTLSHVVSLLFFGLLFGLSLLLRWHIMFRIIFLFFSLLAVWNLYKYYKIKKNTGSLFDNTNIYDIIYKKGDKK